MSKNAAGADYLHFTNVAGYPVRLVVVAVEPGDRSTIVRMIRDDKSMWKDPDHEVSRDIASVALPASKKAIYDQFVPMGFPPHVLHRLAKDLRRASVAVQEKTWEQVLPDDIVRWAEVELRAAMVDEPCCDNTRVARMDSPSQMRRFRRQQEHGCCGSFDFERTGPDGNCYLLGFNYGH